MHSNVASLIYRLLGHFQVTQLRAVCLEQLRQTISCGNIVDYLIAADKCCEEILLEACLDYAAQNRWVHNASGHCVCSVSG